MNKNKRMKRAMAGIIVALVFAASLTAVRTALAGSLWTDTSESMFTDGKGSGLGDIVTIIVLENTTAANTATTDVSQQEKMASSDGTGILNKFFNAFGIQGQDEYKGTGTTSRNGNLRTTISAMITEVLPNGNLIVEASRSLVINDETQMVVLSGVVRPKDIGGDNTVQSSKIANAQIKYTGRGPIARRQHEGILNKLFNWIF